MYLYSRNKPADFDCPHCGSHLEDESPNDAEHRAKDMELWPRCPDCKRQFQVITSNTTTYEVKK
jgi:transposase-like protein